MVFSITIMIRQSLVESAGPFWWPSEFKNVANPDFGNLKHLQNRGHLSLTAASIGPLPNNRWNFPTQFIRKIAGTFTEVNIGNGTSIWLFIMEKCFNFFLLLSESSIVPVNKRPSTLNN